MDEDVLKKDFTEAERLYKDEMDEAFQKGQDIIDSFLSELAKEDTTSNK